MRTAAEISSLASVLRSRYSERDAMYETLWLAYKGDYDQMVGGGYMPVNLQDTRLRASTNIQIWNLIKPIVDTHRYMINRAPAIRVPAAEYGRPEEAGKAERIEKLLYAISDASQLTRRHGEAAFDIALYFATVWMVRWDKQLDHPVIIGRSPKGCYPIPKRHGDELSAVMFVWDEYADELAENYPEAKALLGPDEARKNAKVEVIEYIDANNYQLIIGSKSKSLSAFEGNHKFGDVPVAISAGGHIRGEMFPPPPCSQLVAVNDHMNRFQTKLGDALEAVLFGRHIIQGPGANEVVMNQTPGGVTRIADGETRYEYVQPQAPPREAFAAIEQMMGFMRTHAMWPTSASGEMDASVITGKAVSRLQGVMASMAAEADDNMGRDLARCNTWALKMMEQYRPSKKFVLYSGAPISGLSPTARPSGFKVEVIPERDIQGYYHNEMVYSPFGTDVHAAITLGMQGVQADIISRRALRDMWPGVNDAEGMGKEIEEEKEARMRLEMKLQAEAQQAASEIQMQQQQQMMQMQAGGAPAGPEGGPPPEGGAPPGSEGAMSPDMAPGPGAGPVILPEGRPFAMGMGEPLTGAENFPLPTENVLPYNQALEQLAPRGQSQPQSPEMGPGTVTAEQVTKDIKAVKKLRGSVYLLGQIAGYGMTASTIELGITDKLDKSTIINALPQYRGKLEFTVLDQTNIPSQAILVVEAQAKGKAVASQPAIPGQPAQEEGVMEGAVS